MTPQAYLKFEQIDMSFTRGQMATEVLRDVNLASSGASSSRSSAIPAAASRPC
jgi:hypothetical protein